MRKNFTKYYGITFLCLLLVAFLNPLINGKTIPVDGIIPIIILCFIVSLIIGTFYYLRDRKWGPRKREKQMAKAPFIDFLANGFTKRENYLVGVIRSYTVTVAYGWYINQSGSKILMYVLFRPKEVGYLTKGELKQFSKRIKEQLNSKNFELTACSLGFLIDYSSSKPPTYSEVRQKINQLIDIVSEEQLEPINIEEATTLLPKLSSS